MNVALEREKTAAAHGHPVSEKCEKCADMPMMMMDEPPPPLGGATTFADLKNYRDAQLEEGVYYTATLDYRDLQSNIMNDDSTTVQEKANALVALSQEFKRVVNNIDTYYPNYNKELEDEDEWDWEKAELTGSGRNDLPDSAFAYIEPGGKKDESGKTTPRSLRHFPINDAAHVRAALSRAPQSPFGPKAMPKIRAAAKKFGIEVSDSSKSGRRMSGQQVSAFHSALDTLKSLFSWASYVDRETQAEEEETPLDFEKASGFKLYETKEGPRWVTYSSNAFKDLEGETFRTSALEEAVEWADSTKERGPLRIFHVPGADVGDCDYQAVVGRFLVESGTFRNDDMGQKALEYFKAHDDEDFQVSIGFTYKAGDELDGVYDWLRIRERSITPFGDAANPFTSFAFGGLGGKEMDDRKRKMLGDIFGEDLASRIVGQAETKSKELEDQGVSFKSTDVFGEMTAFARDLPEEQKAKLTALIEKAAAKPNKQGMQEDMQDQGSDNAEEDSSGNKKPAAKKEVDEAVVSAITTLTERLDEFKGLAETVKSLEAKIKEITDEKEEKSKESPRGSQTFRASESTGNMLDPDKIKELVGDNEDKAPVNPARAYVEDLAGIFGGVRN